MVQPIGRNEIQQLAESVRKRDLDALKQVVPETLLNLDQTLNYRFVVDSTFLQILTEIRDGLDLQTKINTLNTQLTDTTVNTFWVPKGLDTQIAYYENKINTLTVEIGTLEWQKVPFMAMATNPWSSKDERNNANIGIRTIDGQIQSKTTEINTAKNNIQTAQTKKEQVEQEKKDLETFWNTYKNIIGTTNTTGTRKRLSDLINIGTLFEINNLIPRQNYGIGEPITMTPVNLNPLFAPGLWAHPISYLICNSQTGEPTPNTWGEFEVTTDGGQTIKLKWIQITGNNIEFNNIQVDPMTGLNFPINLRLAVRGRIQDPVTGMNMDHFKNLDITINQPNFNQAARQNEVNAYNNSWRGHIIEQSLTANHDILMAKLEREAFYRWLEKADGPKFNKLTPEQKEDLYQEVRNMYRTTVGRPRTWTQFTRAANLANMNNFSNGPLSFLQWITWEKHESNKPEFTKNAIAYRDYIHNNLEEQLKKYFEWRFDEVFSKNADGNTYLKTQLTNYLTDIEHQKTDNNVHQNILGDIDDVDRMENRRKHTIDVWGRTYGIWRRDVNYLRFFAGKDSNIEIKNQTVNIATNNRPEDLNNSEPVKYDMNMEISGKQQIGVNIKIDKQKEIKLKAGDPAAMVRTILQCEAIQHGKVRAHIVYNVIKWFIQASKKKDISLTYRDPGTGDMMVIKMDGDNIVLEQQDNQTNYGGTHRRNTTILFDYKYFENSNSFDATRGNENRRLRIGIDRLMGHFNFAMNELHYQYRQATERRWLGLRRWTTRMTLPSSFFLSPIKKIINLRTTTKFDFSTTAQSNGKSISIQCIKNKFTLNMDGLKKPVSSRTFGKLLRHREWWVRIFDGMERDICGKIYEELIKKMRENTKIARTNFWVKDCITGRTYILDSDGQLWYITAEQAASDQNMIRKGRLSKREYGIINNPPAGRTMCDESETREVMKNPFLMGRLIKTMNNRMGIISSTRTLLN
jgi:hypothetical protein